MHVATASTVSYISHSLSHSPHVFTGRLQHRRTVRQIPVMFHAKFLELLSSENFRRARLELHLAKGTIPHHTLSMKRYDKRAQQDQQSTAVNISIYIIKKSDGLGLSVSRVHARLWLVLF